MKDETEPSKAISVALKEAKKLGMAEEKRIRDVATSPQGVEIRLPAANTWCHQTSRLLIARIHGDLDPAETQYFKEFWNNVSGVPKQEEILELIETIKRMVADYETLQDLILEKLKQTEQSNNA